MAVVFVGVRGTCKPLPAHSSSHRLRGWREDLPFDTFPNQYRPSLFDSFPHVSSSLESLDSHVPRESFGLWNPAHHPPPLARTITNQTEVGQPLQPIKTRQKRLPVCPLVLLFRKVGAVVGTLIFDPISESSMGIPGVLWIQCVTCVLGAVALRLRTAVRRRRRRGMEVPGWKMSPCSFSTNVRLKRSETGCFMFRLSFCRRT